MNTAERLASVLHAQLCGGGLSYGSTPLHDSLQFNYPNCQRIAERLTELGLRFEDNLSLMSAFWEYYRCENTGCEIVEPHEHVVIDFSTGLKVSNDEG